jgi:hypothetical protein
MSPRPFAAKAAAQALLHRLRKYSCTVSREEIVKGSLSLTFDYYTLRLEQVPSILNNPYFAGRLLRPDRLVQVSIQFPQQSQRFTVAHEIGHFLLHTGQDHFCDREPHDNEDRAYYEIEADIFAAELLMPPNLLTQQFVERFKQPIDGRVVNNPLFYSIAAERDVSPNEVAHLILTRDPLFRAGEIGTLGSFNGKFFTPLNECFGVSKKAMGIRLLTLQLVQ